MSDALRSANSRETTRATTQKQRHRINWGAYLFLLPAFTLFAVFVVYPVFFNLVLSFHSWNGLSSTWEPVNFEHYERLLNDRAIRLSLRNSSIFVLGHVVTMGIALVLAVFLNRPYPGRNLARTLIFLPAVLPSTVIAVTWGTIYETNLGALNVLLRNIGLDALAQDWLGNPQLAIWSLTAVGIWAGLGFPMVVYLATLQSIDPEVNDAARVDGANGWQLFRYITFPLLRSTHLVLFMLGVIASVQAFDVPFVLTNGGPFSATTTLTVQMYKNVFEFSQFGYGAALSQFTMIVLVVLILLQRFLSRERESR